MGCTGSKKFSANTLEPTEKNPTQEFNHERHQTQPKDDKEFVHQNDKAYPPAEIDGGISLQDEVKSVVSSSEETKEESRDGQREDDGLLADPAPHSLLGAGRPGDSQESLSLPAEVPTVVAVEEESERESKEQNVMEQVEVELVPECSASNDSETAGLSAAEVSTSISAADDDAAAAAAVSSAGPPSTSPDTLAALSAEVLPLGCGSKSQPPSTFSTSSPMMARRKMMAQSPSNGNEDRDRDRDGQRMVPAPSPFMSYLAASSAAGPSSSQSSEKTRQVASFLNPSPSIAFSKSMVMGARARHGSPAIARRASAQTAVTAEQEKPAEEGPGGQDDLTALAPAEGVDDPPAVPVVEVDRRPPSPPSVAVAVAVAVVVLNTAESLLSEQQQQQEQHPPALPAGFEPDVEVTRIDDAPGRSEANPDPEPDPDILLAAPAGGGSADKSDGEASVAVSCASSSSESTPARERLAKRLASIKKLSGSSSSAVEAAAAVSGPATVLPEAAASSPPSSLSQSVSGSGSPPAVVRSSSSGEGRRAAAALSLSLSPQAKAKRPKSPGMAVSRSPSKSPSSSSTTKAKATKTSSSSSIISSASRSRSADSTQAASPPSPALGSGSGGDDNDQILVGLTAAESGPSAMQEEAGAEAGEPLSAGSGGLVRCGEGETGTGPGPGPGPPGGDGTALALTRILLSAAAAALEEEGQAFDLLRASHSSSGDEFLLRSELLDVSSARESSFHFADAIAQPPPPPPAQEQQQGEGEGGEEAVLVLETEAEEAPATAGLLSEEVEAAQEEDPATAAARDFASSVPVGEGREGIEPQGAGAGLGSGDVDAGPERKSMSPVEVFLLGKASKKHTKRVPIASRFPPSPVPRTASSSPGKRAGAGAADSSLPGVSRALRYGSPGSAQAPAPTSAIERIIVQKFPGVVESPPKDEDQQQREDGSAAPSHASSSSCSSRRVAAADDDDNRSVVSALSMRSGESSSRSNTPSATKGPAAAVSPKPMFSSPGAQARKDKDKAVAASPVSAKKAGMPPTPPNSHSHSQTHSQGHRPPAARKADGIADHKDSDDRSVVSAISMRSQGSGARAGSSPRSSLPASRAAVPGRSPLPPPSSSSSSGTGASSKASGVPPTPPQSAGSGSSSRAGALAASISGDLPLSSPEAVAVPSMVQGDSSASEVGVTSLEDSQSVAAASSSSLPPPKQSPGPGPDPTSIPKVNASRRASLTQTQTQSSKGGSSEKRAAPSASASASASASSRAGAAAASKPKAAAPGGPVGTTTNSSSSSSTADSKGKKAKAPGK